jgi:hypothetical protein
VAGSTGGSQQEDGIGIVLTTDKDEETVRKERLMEAAAKKQQNIMPLWHLRSTITDDLTALGIKENAQNAVAGPSNLDESLKGLGKVVRPSSSSSSTDHATIEDADEDAKPGATEGSNEADCKAWPYRSFPFATTDSPFSFYHLLRLRPVLRVFGSFDRAVHTAHTAAGRVLRSGRF